MIEVSNLTKKYGDHIAVDHLSFRVEKGQIYGFLGPNGAGKSTTMNIITGYLAATEGTVTIDGHSTLRGCQITRDDVHGRGFTCSVWTKKAVNLSLFHTEREMIYGNMVTIFFCKIAYFYHICLPEMVFFPPPVDIPNCCAVTRSRNSTILLYEANVMKR